jgi:hypothetical protein
MKRFVFLTLVCFLLLITGCKQSTTSETYDMTGNWTGTIRIASLGVSSVINFTLAQNGSTVTGTFSTDRGRTGTFNGTLSGSSLTGTMTYDDACGGTASIAGTMKNATSMDGAGTVTDCNGSNSHTISIQK